MDALIRSNLTGILAILGAAAILASCGSPSPGITETPASGQTFRLYILSETWDSLRAERGMGYDLESSWPILQQVYTTTAAFTVTVDHIARYDWPNQIITLTAPASQALMAAVTNDAGLRRYADIALDHRAFVVTVDDEPVYGGIFLTRGSPMAIAYPVIHAAWDGDRIVFTLRPTQSAANPADSHRAGIQDDRIRAIFAQARKLVE